MSSNERIPFKVDISRVIEVLAKQIYQSPLALLRENTQNSYDAILLRRAIDPAFDPIIDITITSNSVIVADNGIGMTREQLRNNYWQAGSSSKNTDAARAAGVVGTFGIGAMANFGIAETLIVETETVNAAERITCQANRSTLSATEDCISFEFQPSAQSPGTRVTATLLPGQSIDVSQAVSYITAFIRFLQVKVIINGKLQSNRPYEELVPVLNSSWNVSPLVPVEIGRGYVAQLQIMGASNGEVRVEVSGLSIGEKKLPGKLLVRQGMGSLQTFRSGFGLATTSVHSIYSLGGVADFLFLQPTAGREALSTDSMQLLQDIISTIDDLISHEISKRPEADQSTAFMSWVLQRQKFELCENLKINCMPDLTVTCREIRSSPEKNWLAYSGNDQATMSHATEDHPLIVVSRSNPRRQCETEFLNRFCKVEWMTNDPKIIKPLDKISWTLAHKGLAFRLGNILSSDYFVQADVSYGSITHNLPILANVIDQRLNICLDPEGQTVKLILSLYEKEYLAFESMSKDFVRTIIFPRIADHVPSSTRQGADAFLKTVQRTRETFEYELSDLDSLQSIWADYAEGIISMEVAAERSMSVSAKAVQVIEAATTRTVREVIPDVVENAAALTQSGELPIVEVGVAAPSIQRLEIATSSKLLTIPSSDPALNGYRCFLAVSDRIKEDRGDFFLQPHRTSVVWGGQRVLFVFEHHSGNFGLYYDIQAQELVAAASGGGAVITSTLVLENRIFIPVPPEIEGAFIPNNGERKRLAVKCDLLFID